MDEESDDYHDDDDGADSHDGVEWVSCDRIVDIARSFVVALTAMLEASMMAGWFIVVLLLLHTVHNSVLKQTIITGNTSCCVVHKDDMYCNMNYINIYHQILSYHILSIYVLSTIYLQSLIHSHKSSLMSSHQI